MNHNHAADHRPPTSALVIGALGVVFGDIGTSPLYSFKECFRGHHTVPATPDNVLGVLSLICWTLTLIVTIKYLLFILKADRNGEGGILALLSLAVEKLGLESKTRGILLLTGVAGAALLFGDGIITPAISVLSAVEGLKIITPALEPYIVPVTIVILVVLFMVQRAGSEKVGAFFGPITVLWFFALAAGGLRWIIQDPGVFACVNPKYAIQLFAQNGNTAFFVLGGVFLVVTGGEALYADMGHFGARPIRIGWFGIVFPSLFLNYLGQGALVRLMLQQDPNIMQEDTFSPFYQLFPAWALIPMVILAAAATVIASQALITGTYSLTLQAIQLGYLPRLRILHTSSHTRGQIYIAMVNWLLMLACVVVVQQFRSSEALAAAYGIAVTLTMLVTTVLFYFVARYQWGWDVNRAFPVVGLCLLVEGAFFVANALKVFDGGWLPLAVGLFLFTIMTTWRTGRQLVRHNLDKATMEQEELVESLAASSRLIRVPGTAFFLTASTHRAPNAIMHNIKHNKVIHERVVFLSIVTDDHPFVSRDKQVQLEEIAPGFWRMIGHYGFLQEPNIPQLLRRAAHYVHFDVDPDQVTFFLGRETVVPSKLRGMALWRETVFAFLSKVAEPPGTYFRLPEGRVVELGMRVAI
jgi:KUP system potassium uptake protein